ncbi:MAG: PilZ domain-containing protein [Spirochaetota bacterium]
MNVSIKYEQLSGEIKQEINHFHEKQVVGGFPRSIEDSMKKWFETCFDSWIEARFAPKDIKRRHHRIDVELPIHVVDTLVESDGSDDADIDYVGTIINISRGGLFFKSKKSFELSSIIKVMINMGKIDPELGQLEAIAMVVRCDSLENNEFGIGLMFSSIYEEHKETLDLFILKSLAYFMYKA